ncbi:UDP-2,3-diacylglucosamine diphosphatase LpxI [bacterium]|nr:UDP-2,3-diacylglucosamine diphosphatase LpxI [bacterium]
MSSLDSMGLIAGGGVLPLEFLRAKERNGLTRIVTVGIKNCNVLDEVKALSDHYEEVSVTQLGKLIKIFHKQGVTKAVMLGNVAPKMTIADLRLDWRLMKLAMKVKDRRADSVLGAISDELGSEGITIEKTTDYLPQILLPEGVLCGPPPDDKQWQDIALGVKLALVSGGHDIGQSVVIKNQAVVCVEAMEGTDRCIRRAGEYTKDAVVVKMAKPNQDLRFDVPCLGPGTIESMQAAHARIVAAEAGKTFLLEPQKTLEAAMKCGITILGVNRSLGEK